MRINNPKGLTFAESLISILILAIVVTGGLKLYFYSDQLNALFAHKKIALELANDKLEQLKNIAYPPNPGTDQVIKGLTFGRETVILDPPDAIGGFKLVVVRVQWQETWENGPRHVDLSTYIAP